MYVCTIAISDIPTSISTQKASIYAYVNDTVFGRKVGWK